MDIKLTCPLGSECETARDGYIERCRWYQEYAGKDASGKEHNRWECSMAMMPILQLEAARTNRNVAAAVESARNENIKRQDLAIKAMGLIGLKDAS